MGVVEPILCPIDLFETFRCLFISIDRQWRHRRRVILRFLHLRQARLLVEILLHLVGALGAFAVVSRRHDPLCALGKATSKLAALLEDLLTLIVFELELSLFLNLLQSAIIRKGARV